MWLNIVSFSRRLTSLHWSTTYIFTWKEKYVMVFYFTDLGRRGEYMQFGMKCIEFPWNNGIHIIINHHPFRIRKLPFYMCWLTRKPPCGKYLGSMWEIKDLRNKAMPDIVFETCYWAFDILWQTDYLINQANNLHMNWYLQEVSIAALRYCSFFLKNFMCSSWMLLKKKKKKWILFFF